MADAFLTTLAAQVWMRWPMVAGCRLAALGLTNGAFLSEIPKRNCSSRYETTLPYVFSKNSRGVCDGNFSDFADNLSVFRRAIGRRKSDLKGISL